MFSITEERNNRSLTLIKALERMQKVEVQTMMKLMAWMNKQNPFPRKSFPSVAQKFEIPVKFYLD